MATSNVMNPPGTYTESGFWVRAIMVVIATGNRVIPDNAIGTRSACSYETETSICGAAYDPCQRRANDTP